jgi:CheY-like chemotaxis protein
MEQPQAGDLYSRPRPSGEYNSFQLLSLARQDYTAPATIPEDESTPSPEPAPTAAVTAPSNPSPTTDIYEPPPPAPLHILVVDDDNLTRVLMRKMLTRLGHVVDAVENGRLAVDAMIANGPVPLPTPATITDGSERRSYGLGESSTFHTPAGTNGGTRYDIVFMDNQMPVMSGLEAMRELRKLGGRDFVVGVTGNALTSDVEEFLEAGADHVLTKPVYQRDLEKMLNLARHRRSNPDPLDDREYPADDAEAPTGQER